MFCSPLLVGTTVMVKARIDSVDGRKISLSSEIVSPDESVVYGNATALYIVLKSSV